jgi:hypothetical protein
MLLSLEVLSQDKEYKQINGFGPPRPPHELEQPLKRDNTNKYKCLLHRYWPASHQLMASYQDGRRLSLQLESHYASQQLQKADSCYGQLPRGGGSRQLGSSCQFGLDRTMWQAGVLSKCKLAEECRAASEKVKKKLHPTFKSYLVACCSLLLLGKGPKFKLSTYRAFH